MRMRSHRGLSAVQQGIALLRRLGDRACVFAPGVATTGGAHWISGASLTPTGGIQSLGPNLIANGDFSNGATGWTLWQPTAGVVQLESGGMRIRTTDATFAAIQPTLTLSPGSTYQVTFTVRNWVNGSVQVSIDGTTAAFTSPSAAGTYTFPVVASGSCVVQIKRTGGSNCDLIVDDVSCQSLTTMPTSAWLMDYVESSAATPASVDGPVGFLSDGAGVVGPNVIVNGDFSGGAASWSLGAGWSVSGGLATHASAGGASALGQGSALAIGETYIATVISPTPVAFNAVFGGTYVSIGWKGNVGTCVGVCTASTTFGVQGGGDISFSKIVVQRLTGRHASQGAGANKPTLRRGITCLTYPSSNVSSWGNAGAPVITPGATDPSGGNSAYLWTRVTTGASWSSPTGFSKAATALPVSGAFIVKASTARYFAVRLQATYPARADFVFDLAGATLASTGLNAFTSPTGEIVPLGGGFFLCVCNAISDTGTGVTPFVSFNSNGATADGADSSSSSSGVIYRGGAFAGSLSAAQVLQCGGIPLTTSAATSSLAGNFGLEGDGAAKHLVLASLPFQMSDDHVVIAGGRCDTAIADRSFFGIRSSSSTTPIVAQLGFTAGAPDAVWRDDSGALFRTTSGVSRVGQPCVLSLRKSSGVGALRVNGTQSAWVALTPGATTVNTAAVGGVSTTTPGNLLNGVTNAVVTVKGAISDAELLVLERFVGALTGPTGVKF